MQHRVCGLLVRGLLVRRRGQCDRGGGGGHCGGGIGHGTGHGAMEVDLELGLELAEELHEGEELLALGEELLAHRRIDRGHGALQLRARRRPHRHGHRLGHVSAHVLGDLRRHLGQPLLQRILEHRAHALGRQRGFVAAPQRHDLREHGFDLAVRGCDVGGDRSAGRSGGEEAPAEDAHDDEVHQPPSQRSGRARLLSAAWQVGHHRARSSTRLQPTVASTSAVLAGTWSGTCEPALEAPGLDTRGSGSSAECPPRVLITLRSHDATSTWPLTRLSPTRSCRPSMARRRKCAPLPRLA